MTQEQSEAVHARMRKLKIDNYHPGVDDKLTRLHKIAQDWNLPLEAIAYMGDDLNDLPCLEAVGYAFCPQDAVAGNQGCGRLRDHVITQATGRCAKSVICCWPERFWGSNFAARLMGQARG